MDVTGAGNLQEVLQQKQAIINTAQPLAIKSGQFVFLAAFDGTNNDRNDLSVSGTNQTTNVAELATQAELAASKRRADKFTQSAG